MKKYYFRSYVFGPDGVGFVFYLIPSIEICRGKERFQISIIFFLWRIVFAWYF